MATVSEIAEKSQRWVDNLADNVDRVLNSPEIEEQLTELNRKQLLQDVGADGSPLINTFTGSPKLSKAYAKRTGKTYPNIFLTGAYQKEMFTQVDYSKKNYFQSSYDKKNKILQEMYPNMHGVEKENQEQAKEINGKAIMEDYMQIFE